MSRHGKIFKRTIYDRNEIILKKDYAEIVLYNVKCEEIGRAKINLEDVDKCRKYKWGLNNHGYVITTIERKAFFLHHLILTRKDGYEVDHRDVNPLNNRRGNLRYATHQENSFNKKKARGYCFDKRDKKWIAYIIINNKQINLGYFDTEDGARTARKKAEIKYFGKFRYKGKKK